MGLLKADEGRIEVLGLDPVKDAREVQTRVGYLPDRPDAWPWMRFRDLARFFAAHHPRWDEARANAWADRLEVPRDRSFRAMSRGEGMKAMLAATLAPDPDLLLLDEPFGGLDPVVRDEVVRALVGALGERRRTVLAATHELDLAARLGDRVAILEGASIREEGPLHDVIASGGAGAADALRARLLPAGAEGRYA
jgi:ABC-2 type transport system ATP-binding protein